MVESEYRCPVCKKATAPGISPFPFCSDRCKMVDLGRWMDESYSISRQVLPFDAESFQLSEDDLPDLPAHPENPVD